MASSENFDANYPEVRADLNTVQLFIHAHPEVLHVEQPPDLRKAASNIALPHVTIDFGVDRSVSVPCPTGHVCRDVHDKPYLTHDEYDAKSGAHLSRDTINAIIPGLVFQFTQPLIIQHTRFNPNGSGIAITADAERPTKLSKIERGDNKTKIETQEFSLDSDKYTYTAYRADAAAGPTSVRGVYDLVDKGRVTYMSYLYQTGDKQHLRAFGVEADVSLPGSHAALTLANYDHDGISTKVYFDGFTHKPTVITETHEGDNWGHAYSIGPKGELTPKSWLAGFLDDI